MNYIEEIQKVIDQHDFVEDALPLIDVSKVIEEVMDSGVGYQADAYLEPGYDSPENGKIIFSNWNKFPQYVVELLEVAGHVTEWYDEWLVTDKGNAVRTSPDSYHWKPSYLVTGDGDILTIKDSDEDWIEAVKVTDHMQAIHPLGKEVDLEDYGFEKFNLEEYQAGMFPGMNDNPQEVCLEILEQYPNAEVVFTYSTSQFYTTFDAWYRV